MKTQHRSDYVRDSKLSTKFTPAGTEHIYYARRRRKRTVETWRRERDLGGGSFGEVWLETCVAGDNMGELRAVKELKKEIEGSIVDYTRELEAVAKFSHGKYVHCFVKSFGWYETETTIRIAMEFMSNGDLKTHMNRRFEEAETQKIASQLAEALDFVHSNGFVHRDLKPANILVEEPGPDWWVKVGDFGICKRAERGSTAFRTLIGTEGYIAPEVLGLVLPDDHSAEESDSFFYTRAVDMWALGEIVFRLMTQLPAFPKRGDLGWYAVRQKMLWVKPLRDQDASKDCCDFVIRAMTADPRHRMTAAEAAAHTWVRPSPSSSARSSPSPSIRSSNDNSAFSSSQLEMHTPAADVSLNGEEPALSLNSLVPARTNQPGSLGLEQNSPHEESPMPSPQSTQDASNSDPATLTAFRNIDEDATANWSTMPRIQPLTFDADAIAESHANDTIPTRSSQEIPNRDIIPEDATADWSTAPRVQRVTFAANTMAESDANDSTSTRHSQENPMRATFPKYEADVSLLSSPEVRLETENAQKYGHDHSEPVAEQKSPSLGKVSELSGAPSFNDIMSDFPVESFNKESAEKKKNLWKRALQNLRGKGNNDLSRIEDMLMQLLDETDMIKSQAALNPALSNAEREPPRENSQSNEPVEQHYRYSPDGNSIYHSQPPLSPPQGLRISDQLTSTAQEHEGGYEYDLPKPSVERRNIDLLTPSRSAVNHVRGGSVPLHTPPQPTGLAQHSLSAENTPQSVNKHKSSSSSGWIPKISRWSETTASSVGKAFRGSGRKLPKYDDYTPSRFGSASHDNDVGYQDNLYEDGYYTGFSDQNLGHHAAQPSNGAAVAHRESNFPPDEAAKYLAHRNSLNLQHPQPRPGQTERSKNVLENATRQYDIPIAPSSADWVGSTSSMNRTHYLAQYGATNPEYSTLPAISPPLPPKRPIDASNAITRPKTIRISKPTKARSSGQQLQQAAAESGYDTRSPKLENRNLESAHNVPVRRPSGPRAMAPMGLGETPGEYRRRKRDTFGTIPIGDEDENLMDPFHPTTTDSISNRQTNTSPHNNRSQPRDPEHQPPNQHEQHSSFQTSSTEVNPPKLGIDSNSSNHTRLPVTEDGIPVTIATRGPKKRRSQTSLLIEYFEGGEPSYSSGDRARVRSTSKNRGNDFDPGTAESTIPKTSSVPRLPPSLNNETNDTEDGNRMGWYDYKSERPRLANDPLRTEIDHKRRRRRPASPVIPTLRHPSGDLTEISSIPSDSFLGEPGSWPTELTSGDLDRVELPDGDKLQAEPDRGLRAKNGESTTAERGFNDVETPRLRKPSRKPRRRRQAPTPLAADPNTQSPNLPPGHRLDQRSIRSSSNPSLNNPKLLETVEDAIRRLILPEMNAIKAEQNLHKSRRA